MRVMLMWPTPGAEVKILIDILKERGHEIVYWVGERPVAHFCPQGAIFHDHYDAWDAKPADALKDEHLDPAPAELIESMTKTESLILSMMNKRYDIEPVDERKHVYYTMLGYWSYVLDRCRPDCIVYAQLPHSLYSNIVYDLARSRGIRTLCFEDTWIAYRSIAYEDFWAGSEELREAIALLQKRGVGKKDLDDEMQGYWEEHSKPHSHVEPAYITYQRKTGQGLGLFFHRLRVAQKSLLAGTFFTLTWSYLRRIGKENLKREYARYVKPADFSKPFVYFPLHFQPERTTNPQGGLAYHDQILAIETLSAALPSGWEIFVKEHPSQWWLRGKERYSSSRYRGYYKRVASIANVRLVPVSTSTFELTEKAKAVAVITGTAGWEALFRGKSPLVFGIPWWRDCPGVLRVNSVDSCKEAFLSIERGAVSPQSNVLTFLAALQRVGVRAYLQSPLEKELKLTPEESLRTLALFICDRLGKKDQMDFHEKAL